MPPQLPQLPVSPTPGQPPAAAPGGVPGQPSDPLSMFRPGGALDATRKPFTLGSVPNPLAPKPNTPQPQTSPNQFGDAYVHPQVVAAPAQVRSLVNRPESGGAFDPDTGVEYTAPGRTGGWDHGAQLHGMGQFAHGQLKKPIINGIPSLRDISRPLRAMAAVATPSFLDDYNPLGTRAEQMRGLVGELGQPSNQGSINTYDLALLGGGVAGAASKGFRALAAKDPVFGVGSVASTGKALQSLTQGSLAQRLGGFLGNSAGASAKGFIPLSGAQMANQLIPLSSQNDTAKRLKADPAANLYEGGIPGTNSFVSNALTGALIPYTAAYKTLKGRPGGISDVLGYHRDVYGKLVDAVAENPKVVAHRLGRGIGDIRDVVANRVQFGDPSVPYNQYAELLAGDHPDIAPLTARYEHALADKRNPDTAGRVREQLTPLIPASRELRDKLESIDSRSPDARGGSTTELRTRLINREALKALRSEYAGDQTALQLLDRLDDELHHTRFGGRDLDEAAAMYGLEGRVPLLRDQVRDQHPIKIKFRDDLNSTIANIRDTIAQRTKGDQPRPPVPQNPLIQPGAPSGLPTPPPTLTNPDNLAPPIGPGIPPSLGGASTVPQLVPREPTPQTVPAPAQGPSEISLLTSRYTQKPPTTTVPPQIPTGSPGPPAAPLTPPATGPDLPTAPEVGGAPSPPKMDKDTFNTELQTAKLNLQKIIGGVGTGAAAVGGAAAAAAGAASTGLQGLKSVADSAKPPQGLEGYWKTLDWESRALIVAGLSVATVSALKSMFGGDDKEEGSGSFISKVLPYLGLGAAAWGAGGGTFSQLPSATRYRGLGNGALKSVGMRPRF